MAELDGNWIHGRPDLNATHAAPAQRTYTCWCGGRGPTPTHRSDHHPALYAAVIWRSAPAVAARKASAELHAFLDATPPGDPEDPDADWLAGYVALAGALDAAATALLAELDREAGAL